MRTLILTLLLLAAPAGCATTGNPAAPGFDAAGSDAAAIALADRVMERLGGRAAWDATRVVGWTFFGRRHLLWDRGTGDVRVEREDEASGESVVIVLNLDSGAGRAWVGDDEITDPTERAALVEGARRTWINDSYWLVMPYKLKDAGVTLRSAGRRLMADGRPADVLEVTFTDVGVTPRNRYDVYVAADTGLVGQWDFYADRDDPEPRFAIPWKGWRRYGAIMLAPSRGEGRTLDDIRVLDAPPPGAFDGP